mgnify:CR=1 FL=1
MMTTDIIYEFGFTCDLSDCKFEKSQEYFLPNSLRS